MTTYRFSRPVLALLVLAMPVILPALYILNGTKALGVNLKADAIGIAQAVRHIAAGILPALGVAKASTLRFLDRHVYARVSALIVLSMFPVFLIGMLFVALKDQEIFGEALDVVKGLLWSLATGKEPWEAPVR